MSGWNAASQGWTRQGSTRHGWPRHARRRRGDGLARSAHWTVPDVAALLLAFAIRWELGLAFLALKLWHQVSGSPLSTVGFAREKWERLVAATRSLTGGIRLPFEFGARSSGSPAFDRWREEELARIDAERAKLNAAEQDFSRYRDELLQARDREHFERFMGSRGPSTDS